MVTVTLRRGVSGGLGLIGRAEDAAGIWETANLVTLATRTTLREDSCAASQLPRSSTNDTPTSRKLALESNTESTLIRTTVKKIRNIHPHRRSCGAGRPIFLVLPIIPQYLPSPQLVHHNGLAAETMGTRRIWRCSNGRDSRHNSLRARATR